MSIKPGTTSLPRASMTSDASPAVLVSIAAIGPPAIATSRMASSLREGSMTRPLLMIKSYFAGAGVNAFGLRISAAAPAAAPRNCRLFSIVNLLRQHRRDISFRYLSDRNASDLFHRMRVDGRNRSGRVVRDVNELAVGCKCHPERVHGNGHRAQVLQIGQRVGVNHVV